jgi:hypothetical protein
MFQGFQRYIICYFWMQGSKDMNYTRFNSILIWNSILNLFWFGSWHVACFNSRIPVHVDRRFRPLDLKKRERSRSTRTRSLKWTVLAHWFKIQRLRLKGRELTWIGLGFRWAVPVRARRGRSPASFWHLLDDGRVMMRFGMTPGSR